MTPPLWYVGSDQLKSAANISFINELVSDVLVQDARYQGLVRNTVSRSSFFDSA